jgi:cell filamentation protein
MMEETDFMAAGSRAMPNKLGITDPALLSKAEADLATCRLVELQCSPIRGSFDSAHLQNIHHYLFQDVYEWAGDIVPDNREDVERSLDEILDRFPGENYLRGLDPGRWVSRAGDYLSELDALQPFARGNGISTREFAVELARKNQLGLQWDAVDGLPVELGDAIRQAQVASANLRRLIMLAMDRDASPINPSRGERPGREIGGWENGSETLL